MGAGRLRHNANKQGKDVLNMNPFWIKYKEAGTGVIIHSHASFDDNEVEAIMSFVELAHLLGATNFFLEGENLNISIKGNQNDGLSSTCEMPPDDHISAFLHRLRPFVLQEATHFPHICNILYRRFDNETIRNKLKEQKKIYFGERIRNKLTISVDDYIVNAEETLDKWLNAFEYHHDSDKKMDMKTLHEILPKEITRALFLQMLCEKTDAIFYIQWLIKSLRRGTDCGVNQCPISNQIA